MFHSHRIMDDETDCHMDILAKRCYAWDWVRAYSAEKQRYSREYNCCKGASRCNDGGDRYYTLSCFACIKSKLSPTPPPFRHCLLLHSARLVVSLRGNIIYSVAHVQHSTALKHNSILAINTK